MPLPHGLPSKASAPGLLRLTGLVGMLGAVLILAGLYSPARAQSDVSDDEMPTVKQPVRITAQSASEQVAPGQESALKVTFRVPKFMWLGARPGQDRTPAGTRIKMEDHPQFAFGDPIYPEPSVEGVPVHVGLTRVYQGEVTVIVPYRVAEDAPEDEYELTALLTYTPGFSAGKLSTHVDEPHTATVRVQEGASVTAGDLPEPSVGSVPSDFQVQPQDRGFPAFLGPMFHQYEEGTAFTKAMHTFYLDPSNHNKGISHVTYPFLSSTRQSGNSYGVGVALLNSTPEGVMTGTTSLLGFQNEFVGATIGFDHITCPAAYHNMQLSVRSSFDDFQLVDLDYENFVLGENDRWGIQVDAIGVTDPRTRFYGVGSQRDREELSVYDHEEIGGTVDLYHLPTDHWRVGIGFKVREVGIDQGLTDITDSEIPTEFAPQIDDPIRGFVDEERVTGSTITGGRFNVIYDQRNQEFNPTKGFLGKFTAEFNHLIDDEGAGLTDNYGSFDVDLRKYFSTVDQKLYVLLRNQWTFTTSEDVPFYELGQLGGPSSLRAFDQGRFHGQHAGFASMEARYVVMNVTIMGFPMSVQMGGFVDVGQVFTDTDEFLNADVNVNPGGSIRFVNYPNVGYVLNLANGQDGVNVTGGITLPF